MQPSNTSVVSLAFAQSTANSPLYSCPLSQNHHWNSVRNATLPIKLGSSYTHAMALLDKEEQRQQATFSLHD
jgi:hypothetical protein